jgi:hypothetical protein
MNQNFNYQDFYKEAIKNNPNIPHEYNQMNNYYNSMGQGEPIIQNNLEQRESTNMYSPYEAFIRGNLWKDLYKPYKISHPFEIKPMNEQANMLTQIDALSFSAHELNLYLDNKPNDKEMIQKFEQLKDEANKIKKEYEKKYGPLLVDGHYNNSNTWTWNDAPWPWENR